MSLKVESTGTEKVSDIWCLLFCTLLGHKLPAIPQPLLEIVRAGFSLSSMTLLQGFGTANKRANNSTSLKADTPTIG